jgi:hypothetical protein
MWKLDKEDFHLFLSDKEKEARGLRALALVVMFLDRLRLLNLRC